MTNFTMVDLEYMFSQSYDFAGDDFLKEYARKGFEFIQEKIEFNEEKTGEEIKQAEKITEVIFFV